MSGYSYEAVDSGGLKIQGRLNVADQGEALKRVKEMGLFPTKIAQVTQPRRKQGASFSARKAFKVSLPFHGGRVKRTVLAVFTRQIATLIEAGMPLLRGLRILEEQEESHALKRIIGELAFGIESGGSLSEALASHPKVFNLLYVNMVKAGEMSGALDVTLRRLAEFMEKTQKIKGKIKAAMFYPAAVIIVATAIVGVLMVYVIPKFQMVFEGLLNGASMPVPTLVLIKISEAIRSHILVGGISAFALIAALLAVIRTNRGRRFLDRFKLKLPILGPVFRKVAVSRFARTLGTLLGNGVPVLQALTIVKDTTGNVIVSNVISTIHESVKEGETIAQPLKASGVFPAMVAGMVDVGEQTGALPEMLMKIADNYDGEVDNAVSAMTSLLEPVMIVFLAVIVGSIVVAMYLPLIKIMETGFDNPQGGADN
jgi:type IV pilus assembly protein PilC